MSLSRVCSSRSHPLHNHLDPSHSLAQYRRRCEQVQRSPIDVLPQRIDALLNAFESSTKEQSVAAESCSCPLCMQVLFDGGRAPYRLCSVCNRRCCQVCSLSSESDVSSTLCRSQTCVAISKFNSFQLSLEALAAECDRIARDLLRQWLVLQLKGEIQLGPLRALILVDAKHAALSSIAAISSAAAHKERS